MPTDDLYSYTLFGLVRAANNYDPDRHVPFDIYAARKAMYVAIDEMRKDRVLRRSRPGRVTNAISLDKLLKSDRKDLWRLCDRTAEQARDRLEAREWCQAMLSQLDEKDRRLMLLRYADDMTFRQIGQVMGVSESTACLRHSMLLDRFRSVARQLYCTRRGAPARWKIGR